MIEQAKCTYSLLGKSFEKQTKTIEDLGEKQVNALNTFKFDNKKITIEDVISKSVFASDEAKEDIEKIVKIEKTINREKLVYKASGNTYDFRKFQTMRTFGNDIYEGKITLEKAPKDQSDLSSEFKNFNDKIRPKSY